MRFLIALLEIPIVIFASWTVAYHAWLVLNLPAGRIVLPFLLLLGALLWIFWRRWWSMLQPMPADRRLLLGTALLAGATGLFALINPRWSVDDFAYVHRSLVQLQHLNQPFLRIETGLNTMLPALLNFITPAHEPFVVMTAALFGIDPLLAYQNIGAALAASFLPIVYVVLYRTFRLAPCTALAATCLAVIFLVSDGNGLYAFGNWLLGRIWQGKAIANALLMPTTVILAWRFLLRPTRCHFLLVVLAGVCAAGLSNSGLFLFPVLLVALSLVYLVSHRWSWQRVQRVLVLNLASFYCVVLAASILFGLLTSLGVGAIATSVASTEATLRFIQSLSDPPPWSQVSPDWAQNLYEQSIRDPATLLRNILILLLLPALSIRRPLLVLLYGYMGALITIFANPLLGPLWIKAITPLTYHRLIYLFPLPWCVGLIIPSIGWQGQSIHKRLLHIGTALLVLVAVLHAYSTPILGPRSEPVRFKHPWDYRFPPDERAFALRVAPSLGERSLLAPPNIALAVGLLNPTVRLDFHASYLLLSFGSADQFPEGLRRLAAQARVDQCRGNTVTDDIALLESLATGVNALILRDCGSMERTGLQDLLRVFPRQWTQVVQSNDYLLWLPETSQAVGGQADGQGDAPVVRLLTQARVAVEQQQPQAAIDAVDQLLRQQPDWATAYVWRGQLLAQTGALAEAITSYDQAIRRNPDLLSAYVAVGRTLLRAGEPAQAIERYTTAIQHAPDEAHLYLQRAQAYEQNRAPQRAIDDYTVALSLDPTLIPAYIGRGRRYVAQENWERAFADFDQILALQPGDARALMERGRAYVQQQNWPAAISEFTLGIANNPNWAALYFERGQVYGHEQAWEQAIADFSQSLNLEPGQLEVYRARAQAYIRQQNWAGALADWSYVIAHAPHPAPAYVSRGNVYRAMGQLQMALADYDEAIALAPESAWAYFERGVLYRQLGNRAQALADLRQVLQLNPNANLHQRAEQQLRALGAEAE